MHALSLSRQTAWIRPGRAIPFRCASPDETYGSISAATGCAFGAPVRIERTARGRTAPPSSLIHGLGGSGRDWEYVAQELLARGAPLVIASDLFGVGDSDKPRDASYTPTFHARALETCLDGPAIMPWRGAGQATLRIVGHSSGGVLAAVLTVQNPDRIRTLVLVAAPFPDGSRATWN